MVHVSPALTRGSVSLLELQIGVTLLTEKRMLERPARGALYREYMRETSVWLPLPPRIKQH